MKKKLLTILVTSLVMIAAMGIFLFKMNSMTKHMEKKQEALRKEEMDTDLKTKAFEDIDKLDLQTLYISGDKKNVVTTGNKELNDIYSKGKYKDQKDGVKYRFLFVSHLLTLSYTVFYSIRLISIPDSYMSQCLIYVYF